MLAGALLSIVVSAGFFVAAKAGLVDVDAYGPVAAWLVGAGGGQVSVSPPSVAAFVRWVGDYYSVVYAMSVAVAGAGAAAYFYSRVESGYLVFEAASRYSVAGLLWRVYLLGFAAAAAPLAAAGFLSALPLVSLGVLGLWEGLRFGAAAWLLLYALWAAVYSAAVGVGRDVGSAVLSVAGVVAALWGASVALGAASPFAVHVAALPAALAGDARVFVVAELPGYPAWLVAAALVGGVGLAARRVAGYEHYW